MYPGGCTGCTYGVYTTHHGTRVYREAYIYQVVHPPWYLGRRDTYLPTMVPREEGYLPTMVLRLVYTHHGPKAGIYPPWYLGWYTHHDT